MAQRRRHPVVGWVMALLLVLATAVGVLIGLAVALSNMGCDSTRPGSCLSAGDVALWVGIATLVSLGGLWVAWRVGSGRWGLRRRPATGAKGGGDE